VFDDFVKQQTTAYETIQMSAKDNFEQLLATDNYLEKYIPFRIQSMISDSVMSFLESLD